MIEFGSLRCGLPNVTATGQVARFGNFEVDLRQGHVSRNGVPIVIQEKPLQLLLALLEKPEQLITRAELFTRLWPTTQFGAFDDGLNTAMRKLRQALDDSAEVPRLIQTVPKRGYRFVAPIEFISPVPPQSDNDPASTKCKRPYIGASIAIATVVVGLTALLITTETRSARKSIGFSSIVVLPLEQLSADPSQQYFADGMTDALITDLAKVSSLRVISRTSAMHFRGTHLTVQQIGTQLGVDAVVEGSVMRSGNRVRINAQLIDARQDRHLWAESYDGEMNEILALQNAVAESIAQHVEASLLINSRRKPKAPVRVNAAAYEEYLKGRYHWAKYTGSDWQKAREHFNAAIARDPTYAPAYVGLADSYMLLAAYEHEPTREAIPPGIAALHRALELDPDLPDAHYSLAFAKTNYEYDWAGAEAEFRTGLTLNPNYAIGRMWHSLLLSVLNRHNEAIAEELHAYQLDPVSPIVQTNLCRAYVFAQRPEDSVPTCKQALDLDSRFVPAYSWLSRAYMNLNQPEKAFAVEQKAWEVRGDRALMQHRELLHRRGEDRALVLEELESAVLRYQKSSIGAHDIAAMYGALNKLDQAFEYLDKAYYAREAALCVINTNPVWSPLRSDPRFRNILRRMNLAK